MTAVKSDRASKELFQDPLYTCDQIIGTMDSLKKDTEGIFNLPPPKPKSPEKPAEDKKEDLKQLVTCPDCGIKLQLRGLKYTHKRYCKRHETRCIT